ncbi:MAG: dipicolinate synthase subunit DpsA [Alicyclobacillaceae bacterium]|nr:dipicolinate synthase subunit DpsA [Alicyclobacillaceae bacterium]
MLTGKTIAFVGGDARILEVIRYAVELDATAVLIGFDRLEAELVGTEKADLAPDVLRAVDALVLPVAGLDEDGYADSGYSAARIRILDEHFSALPRSCQVFTGIAGPYLEQMCRRHGVTLVKLFDLDEVAILNSIPTAEGAIQMAMENTDITIHGSRSVVLGFGRCGITLARTLAAMGARVKVGARKPADLARVQEMGLLGFSLEELADQVEDADLIFNTIPAPVLTAEVLARIPRGCLIIDIASKPGGTDFRYAQRRGIRALLAPSLPGIVAPKTAGQILAKTLCRYIWEAG